MFNNHLHFRSKFLLVTLLLSVTNTLRAELPVCPEGFKPFQFVYESLSNKAHSASNEYDLKLQVQYQLSYSKDSQCDGIPCNNTNYPNHMFMDDIVGHTMISNQTTRSNEDLTLFSRPKNEDRFYKYTFIDDINSNSSFSLFPFLIIDNSKFGLWKDLVCLQFDENTHTLSNVVKPYEKTNFPMATTPSQSYQEKRIVELQGPHGVENKISFYEIQYEKPALNADDSHQKCPNGMFGPINIYLKKYHYNFEDPNFDSQLLETDPRQPNFFSNSYLVEDTVDNPDFTNTALCFGAFGTTTVQPPATKRTYHEGQCYIETEKWRTLSSPLSLYDMTDNFYPLSIVFNSGGQPNVSSLIFSQFDKSPSVSSTLWKLRDVTDYSIVNNACGCDLNKSDYTNPYEVFGPTHWSVSNWKASRSNTADQCRIAYNSYLIDHTNPDKPFPRTPLPWDK